MEEETLLWMMTSKLDLQWGVFHDADIHVELVWAGLIVDAVAFQIPTLL